MTTRRKAVFAINWMEVEALTKDGTTIIHRSFYTSDMVSLIRDGHIKISKV